MMPIPKGVCEACGASPHKPTCKGKLDLSEEKRPENTKPKHWGKKAKRNKP